MPREVKVGDTVLVRWTIDAEGFTVPPSLLRRETEGVVRYDVADMLRVRYDAGGADVRIYRPWITHLEVLDV